MKIKITERCLKDGGISACNCPVNLALRYCGCYDVMVHPTFATFYIDGIFQQIDFPENVKDFIYRWDTSYFNWRAEPFEFEAEPFQVNRGE